MDFATVCEPCQHKHETEAVMAPDPTIATKALFHTIVFMAPEVTRTTLEPLNKTKQQVVLWLPEN